MLSIERVKRFNNFEDIVGERCHAKDDKISLLLLSKVFDRAESCREF